MDTTDHKAINLVADDVFDALVEDFIEHGAEAIDRFREAHNMEYVLLVSELVKDCYLANAANRYGH